MSAEREPTEAEIREYERQRDDETWNDPLHWSKLPPMTETEMDRDSDVRARFDQQWER